MPSKDEARRRQSSMLPLAAPARLMPAWMLVSKIRTRRSGSGYGSGRSTMPCTRAKRIVLTPMPAPMVADRQQGHAGRTAQDPCGVDQLSRELLQRESRPAFRHLLPRGFHGADLDPHLPPGLCLVDAGLDLARHQHLDVMRELFRRLAIELASPHDLQHTAPQSASCCHSTSARSTRIMAATLRSQAFCPVDRRRRSSAVKHVSSHALKACTTTG